ncbi:LLM class flavin-dependent oxidoreductase, partial [Frankia sp. AvcI1]
MTNPTAIPETASPQVEFISLSHLNPSTELNPVPSRGIDLPYFKKYVRALEESGYDYTLLPYGSNSADSFVLASAVGQLTERLRPIVALR